VAVSSNRAPDEQVGGEALDPGIDALEK